MKARSPLAARMLALAMALILKAQPSIAESNGPLTNRPGDQDRGLLVFLDSERGHCLLCHQLSSVDAPFQGNIGPTLDAVGDRLSAGSIRARIVDPTRLNPATAMPAYHRTDDLHQVATKYKDRPILTAQEVEDLVAFLRAQRHQQQGKTP